MSLADDKPSASDTCPVVRPDRKTVTRLNIAEVEKVNFSERYGYEPLPKPMRLEELSEDLRRELWDEVRQLLFRYRNGLRPSYFFNDNGRELIERVLGEYQRKPRDEIHTSYDHVLDYCKHVLMNGLFFKVLTFLEILIAINEDETKIRDFGYAVEQLFEKHGASYRLDTSALDCEFFPCSSEEQAISIQKALKVLGERNMKGAATHLRDAAGHINDGQFADSVADSIHAVESVARIFDPKAKSLTPALNSLEKAGVLNHRALKEAFSKLYGYTSDEQGIRHALLTSSAADVGQDEALFMFGACASFAAYLTQKHQQVKGSV